MFGGWFKTVVMKIEPKTTKEEKENLICLKCGQGFEKMGNLKFHKIINKH